MNLSVQISRQAGRKFALDMAGFAINLQVVHANPEATIPTRVSYLEDGFLRQLHLELDDLEPLAAGCTEVISYSTCSVCCSYSLEEPKKLQRTGQ